MALSVPPGFVFHPLAQTLITDYLIPKAKGLPLPPPILARNLYEGNGTPWIVLPDKDSWPIAWDSGVRDTKKEIYVCTKLKRNGRGQFVRVAGCGTWNGKAGGEDIKNGKGEVIGVKKSFTFRVKGNSKEITKPKGRWIMHEYTLKGSSLKGVDNTDYAICQIIWDLPKCCVKEESWPTKSKISNKEFSSFIEETTWNQPLHEAAVSWSTELAGEEMTWNQALHYQKLNSEAAVSLPPIVTNEEFSRFIEETTWNQALHDQELNFEAATEEIPSYIVETMNSEAAVKEPTEEFYNLGQESSIGDEFLQELRRR